MSSYVPPSVKATAFNCPHCRALTSQVWHSVHVDELKHRETPEIYDAAWAASFSALSFPSADQQSEAENWAERLRTGRPFLEHNSRYRSGDLNNVWASHCFNCGEFAIWVAHRLLYPMTGTAPEPHADMPAVIRADYEEASVILNASPRGAAALLRLAIQKLCKELGQKGKNIDEDIAGLVKGGLPIMLQQAFDTLRVTGNEAVHPGSMDLKDDVATAEGLFRLVNIIIEKMIGEPKHVKELYAKLPVSKVDAIDQRDSGSRPNSREK